MRLHTLHIDHENKEKRFICSSYTLYGDSVCVCWLCNAIVSTLDFFFLLELLGKCTYSFYVCKCVCVLLCSPTYKAEMLSACWFNLAEPNVCTRHSYKLLDRVGFFLTFFWLAFHSHWVVYYDVFSLFLVGLFYGHCV